MNAFLLIIAMLSFTTVDNAAVEKEAPGFSITYSLTAFAKHNCDNAELRSGADLKALTITFVNNTEQEITLMHVGTDGKQRRIADLDGGQTKEFATYQGHVIAVRDQSNACKALLVATSASGTSERVVFAAE
jgi:hypothetical protein